MGNILDLPEEILSRIFEFVETERDNIPPQYHFSSKETDISNCRLVCKRFCAASSRLLIRRVTVDVSVSSLSRFQEISSHDILSKGVRCVRVQLHLYHLKYANSFRDFSSYYADMFEELWERSFLFTHEKVLRELLSISNLEGMSDTWRRSPSVEHESEEEREQMGLLKTMHLRYQELYRDQQRLLTSKDFLHVVAEGMVKMAGARKLLLVDEMSRPFQTLLPSTCKVLPAAMFPPVPEESCFSTSSGYELFCYTELIYELPSTIGRAGLHLEEIYIKLPNLDLSSTMLTSVDVPQGLAYAVERLERFTFDSDVLFKEDSDLHKVSAVLAPLLSTTNLKSIHIYFSDDWSFRGLVPFGSIFKGQQWPNLANFHLEYAEFSLTELQSFLSQPRSRLCRLRLDSCGIVEGTWAEALDILRDKPIPLIQVDNPQGAEIDGLSSVAIDNLFLEGQSSALNLYVNKVTDQNPLTAWAESEEAESSD